MNILPEPSLAFPLTKALADATLIVLYFIGVWLRNFVVPADITVPLKNQLAAAVVPAFPIMGAYAKIALPPLLISTVDPADVIIMIGNVIFLGMMSREALEKLIKAGLRFPNAPN